MELSSVWSCRYLCWIPFPVLMPGDISSLLIWTRDFLIQIKLKLQPDFRQWLIRPLKELRQISSFNVFYSTNQKHYLYLFLNSTVLELLKKYLKSWLNLWYDKILLNEELCLTLRSMKSQCESCCWESLEMSHELKESVRVC